MLAIFCLLMSSSIGAFGCIGSLVDVAQDYYGVSDIEFNTVYYGSYVDFLISAPIWNVVIFKHGLRTAIIAGSILSPLGYALQLFYKYSFWVLPVGGMITDSCRCLCWIAGNMFISRWFSTNNKTITYGSLFVSASTVGITLVAIIRLAITDTSQYDERFMWFIVSFLVLSSLASLLAIFLFDERPKVPPGPQSEEGEGASGGGHLIYTEWRRTNYYHVILFVAAYICTTMGNWSISMVLLQFMKNKNYSNEDITIAAISYSLCSLPTPLITGYIMDRTKAYRQVAFAVLLATTGTFVAWMFAIDDRIFFLTATGVLAFVTGSYSATWSACVSELAFPVHESYVSTTMFLFAQVSAPVGTVLCSFSETIDSAIWIFMGIYGFFTIAVGISLFYPVTYRRLQKSPMTFNLTPPDLPAAKQM